MLKVLGLSFGYHDSSASLVIDGEFIAGTQEERYTRKKHDASFPQNSIEFCLRFANLSLSEIDHIVYHENTALKLDRILNTSIQNNVPEYLSGVINSWIEEDAFSVESKIAELLNFPIEKITCIDHHEAHASSAFFPSPFESAAILTIDAVGEYETTSIYKGNGNDLEKIKSHELPNSIGLFYSAYTSFLGFEVNEGEYKIMGMAAFGDPIFTDKIKETIEINGNGEITINTDYFQFLTPTSLLYTQKLVELFGSPRKYDTPFFTPAFIDMAPEGYSREEKNSLAATNKMYADIAASLQKITEEIILKLVNHAIDITGYDQVCLAGGVALNSVANGLLRDKANLSKIFIQPAAGDGGSSLGAALHYSHNTLNIARGKNFWSCYKGESWNKEEILGQIEKYTIEKYERIDDRSQYFDRLTDILISKNVVGWHNGRAEWGPRALGCRSILADPTHPDTQEIVNRKIKFREPYRPFAPSVLAEHAHEWFEFKGDAELANPDSFMLAIADVKEEKKGQIPAVTHADGTARIQLVWKETNPDYYNLIHTFYKKSGVPILLNTSFNLRGEPIVNSPYDAILTFSYSDMDYLAMPPFLVSNFWEFGGRNGK